MQDTISNRNEIQATTTNYNLTSALKSAYSQLTRPLCPETPARSLAYPTTVSPRGRSSFNVRHQKRWNNELVRTPKHSIELARQKSKIQNQKDEIRKLKEVIRDFKAILARAKQNGFTHTERVTLEDADDDFRRDLSRSDSALMLDVSNLPLSFSALRPDV